MKVGHNDRERAMVPTMPSMIQVELGELELVSRADGVSVYRNVTGSIELTDSITRKGGKVRRLIKFVYDVVYTGGDGLSHTEKRQHHIVDMYDDPKTPQAYDAHMNNAVLMLKVAQSLTTVAFAAPASKSLCGNMKRCNAGLGPEDGNYNGILTMAMNQV